MAEVPPAIPPASTPTALLSARMAQTLAQSLRTWQTVDRRQVHKAAVSEVLVTDLVQLASHRYAIAVQWPRWHPYFRPQPDRAPHPLLFVESLRQAGIYLTHQSLGVPLGQHFIFQAIGSHYSSAAEVTLPPEPITIVLAIHVSPANRGARSAGAQLDIEAWFGDHRLATAEATYRCLSAAAYARVRAQALAAAPAGETPPCAPLSSSAEVPGHMRQKLLQVNFHSPTFFDHAVDHLPGILLMDGALSGAGISHPSDWPRLMDFQLNFHRYAELHLPTLVTTRPVRGSSDGLVAVTISQRDQEVASGTVKLGQTPRLLA